MLYFKDYESFIEASLTHRISVTESENVARFILHIRQRFFCYEQLDVNNRHFFTTDEVITAAIQPFQYDYLSLPAFRLIKVVSHIVTNLRSGIVRENELMPMHKANEFNSFSINWLSKRPGRTVREKLSGKKSIMAVRRRMSLDTPENRLVKALLVKMSLLLHKKLTLLERSNLSDNMPDEERELLQKCSFFLHSNESKEIGIWNNLPPNNTLLSDRFYHGAWTAWNDLKRINQQIQADYKNIEQLICNLSVMRLIQVASSCFEFPKIPFFYDWQEHSGMLWSVISHIAGIGERGILQIDWSQEKSLLLSYCGETVIVTFKSMGIQINGKEKSLKKNFSAVLLYMQLENALKMVCGIDYKKNTLSYKNLPSRVFSGQNAVIDLFTIRPKIIVDKKSEVLPEFLLWQKMYRIVPGNKQEKEIVFSVGTANVLLGAEKSELSTIISAVEDESANKNLFLQRHLSILKKYIKADNLSFLYPDCYNEFQLQAVKQMAKMYYYQVRAVPRSLDVVFRYVKHNMKQFGANDAFILIDRVSSFVSMTIVVSVFNEELKKTAPKTRGFIWEHHPSALFDYDLEAAIAGLTGVDKEAATFFGNELLHCQNAQLVFVSTNDESVVLQDLRNKLLSQLYDVSNQLEQFIMANSRILKGRKLHVIKLANEISFSKIQLKRIVLDSVSGDVGEGVLYYDELANRVNTISLWRDYLPNIAIKRMIGFFDLVKDSTFEYGSVKEKEITINTHFTLPSGQKEYHFQLNMETASKKAIYEAVVRNRAFPLEHDTECELRMKYTYNADNPYSLQFIPINRKKAGFAEANVSWEPLIKYRTEDLPYQDLPKTETWETLEQYPNKYSPGETINLLEQLEERIKYLYYEEAGKVLDISIKDRSPMVYLKVLSIDGSAEVLRIKKDVFLKTCEEVGAPINYNFSLLKNFWKGTTVYGVGKKIINRFSTQLNNNDWNNKGRIEKEVCIENLPLTVVFDKSNFIFNESETLLPAGVTFYVNTNKIVSSNWDISRPIHAFDILPKGVAVYEVSKIATNSIGINETDDFISHFKTQKNYLLFLMHNIYSNGRTIHDNLCPEKYKKGLLNNIERLFNTFINLYNNHDFDEYRSYLFSILCIANRDVGNRFYKFLDAYIKKSCDYKMAIPPFLGYALGNFEIPAERKLFNSLTELHFSGYEYIGLFSVLSRIVWKNDDFLMNAPSTILIRLFEEAVTMVINELRITRKVRNDLLEYILAVFRLRKKRVREINEKLSLNNPLIANLYSLLEELILKKRFPEFETRIKLTIEKGGEYYASEIPDLIYALIVCISGTNKENTILISSIDDEDSLVYEQYKVC